MSKKRIISISIISILVFGILAYATNVTTVISEISKSNVSASNVRVELVMLEEGEGGQVPVSGSVGVLPGDTKSRIAKVKNIGKEPAWVRIEAVVDAPHGTETVEEFGYIELGNVNEKHWAHHHDGYWYYNQVLAPGETTEPLFTEISFTDDILDRYQGHDLNVKVIAQGTQEKHNGSTAYEAQGWPEE